MKRATEPGRAVEKRPLTKSKAMARVRQRGTAPELLLRSALWRRGLRYRVNVRKLPGSPDIVFGGPRVAVFVHGCFWHGHSCPHGARRPRANADYWAEKTARNQARDAASWTALEAMGWAVAVVWECEPVELATQAVATLVAERRGGRLVDKKN